MTISLRLDTRTNARLTALAKARGVSKSELIRTCLALYLASEEQKPTAWTLGKHLFGCYDSGRGDLSARARETTRGRVQHARLSTNDL